MTLNLKKFYKGKKIFITGHTGFKGKWLVATLLKLGSKITGFSLNDEKRKDYEKFLDFKKIKNIYADVGDYKKLRYEIKNTKIKNLIQFLTLLLTHRKTLNKLL